MDALKQTLAAYLSCPFMIHKHLSFKTVIHFIHQKLSPLIAVGIIVGLIILPLAAFANAPPPPPMTWIDFEKWNDSIDTVQIVTCDSQECKQPKLFAQYGQCNQKICALEQLLNKEKENPIQLFDCQDKTCLVVEKDYSSILEENQLLQLRVHSREQMRASPTFVDPQSFQKSWSVTPENNALNLKIQSSWERPRAPAIHWGIGFILTLSIEFLVLSSALRYLRLRRLIWLRIYATFFLVHLVTYPLVWTLPVGLLPFQEKISRFAGFGELLVSIVLLGFLYCLRKAKTWKIVLSSLLLLLLLQGVVFMISLGLTYGDWLPFTTGINFGVAIGVTELLITIIEAIAFKLLSRDKLTILTSGLISLCMNGASILIGLLYWKLRT